MQRRSLPYRLLILTVLTLALTLAFIPVTSAGGGTLDFTINCSGFFSNGSELVLNRDNTGALSEAFIISAIDGAGTTIFSPLSDVFFIGTSIEWAPGEGYEWTARPFFNPIRLEIVSPAGNGLPEQVVYSGLVICPGLPIYGPINVLGAFAEQAVRQLTGEAFVLQAPDGTTSDPVPLNAEPPRPINPDALLEGLPGSAIVNTDHLFLRSGDSARYTVIGVLDGGTQLAVLGRNEDRSWWYVQVGGLRGWVSNEFLVLRGDLTRTRVVPVTGSFTQPSLYVGFSGNPVYPGPRLGEVVCTIPGNIEFPIEGRTAASDWYLITVECDGVSTPAWIQADRGLVRNPAGVFIPVVRQ